MFDLDQLCRRVRRNLKEAFAGAGDPPLRPGRTALVLNDFTRFYLDAGGDEKVLRLTADRLHPAFREARIPSVFLTTRGSGDLHRDIAPGADDKILAKGQPSGIDVAQPWLKGCSTIVLAGYFGACVLANARAARRAGYDVIVPYGGVGERPGTEVEQTDRALARLGVSRASPADLIGAARGMQ